MLEETGSDADAAPRPSVNEAASRLVARMLAKAAALRIAPSRGPAGELLIDCGTAVTGGIAAGLWLENKRAAAAVPTLACSRIRSC